MIIKMPVQRQRFVNGDSYYDDPILVEIVDVAPHLPATFAVGINQDARGDKRKLWRCYNVETGMASGYVNDSPTKKLCIQRARRYLARKTPNDLKKAFRKCPATCRGVA